MNILRTADVIAAEDTRTTGSLLKLLGVERKGRLVSHHDHNTKRRVPEIVDAARYRHSYDGIINSSPRSVIRH